jgi:hypothetical protein
LLLGLLHPGITWWQKMTQPVPGQYLKNCFSKAVKDQKGNEEKKGTWTSWMLSPL